ncbi:MAG TPA: hypothetical protein VH107_13695 [Lacipirellulaceae bacterium]|jgi:hypothetical protein|nr:hypothetical protein [Lacipirellulaceae bacterium]
MKSALLVLALAASTVGCQAMGPGCGQPLGDACGGNAPSCHMRIRDSAPRPGGCCEGVACDSCGRGGNLNTNCPGGNGCAFDRYHGSACGPGYPNGQYDCSPCCSPNWGCNGYQHPRGYQDNQPCLCQNGQCGPGCNNYCGSGPAVGGCPCGGCGPSGDQNYNFNPGPPVAQTAYPYYTLRGPRDFLLGNPPSIGPY